MARVWQHLNTYSNSFCLFINVFINALIFSYLNTIFKYILVYLNTMYLNTLNGE